MGCPSINVPSQEEKLKLKRKKRQQCPTPYSISDSKFQENPEQANK